MTQPVKEQVGPTEPSAEELRLLRLKEEIGVSPPKFTRGGPKQTLRDTILTLKGKQGNLGLTRRPSRPLQLDQPAQSRRRSARLICTARYTNDG